MYDSRNLTVISHGNELTWGGWYGQEERWTMSPPFFWSFQRCSPKQLTVISNPCFSYCKWPSTDLTCCYVLNSMLFLLQMTVSITDGSLCEGGSFRTATKSQVAGPHFLAPPYRAIQVDIHKAWDVWPEDCSPRIWDHIPSRNSISILAFCCLSWIILSHANHKGVYGK